ncbi:hypothetical protein ABR738_19635 [Streptomyces sp. Edi4]
MMAQSSGGSGRVRIDWRAVRTSTSAFTRSGGVVMLMASMVARAYAAV